MSGTLWVFGMLAAVFASFAAVALGGLGLVGLVPLGLFAAYGVVRG
jgi:hypothetical protein